MHVHYPKTTTHIIHDLNNESWAVLGWARLRWADTGYEKNKDSKRIGRRKVDEMGSAERDPIDIYYTGFRTKARRSYPNGNETVKGSFILSIGQPRS